MFQTTRISYGRAWGWLCGGEPPRDILNTLSCSGLVHIPRQFKNGIQGNRRKTFKRQVRDLERVSSCIILEVPQRRRCNRNNVIQYSEQSELQQLELCTRACSPQNPALVKLLRICILPALFTSCLPSLYPALPSLNQGTGGGSGRMASAPGWRGVF